MTITTTAAVADIAPERGVRAHDHAWRLRAVWHEDGAATEEYACTGCASVTFR